MTRKSDLAGKKLGLLTVVELISRDQWECQCECGKTVVINHRRLTQRNCISCGCRFSLRHGYAPPLKTPEYRSWQAMKNRCQNKNNKQYHRYGGRGITVCERWSNSFSAFLEDMGLRPLLSYSIERVDNDGNYEPSNCKWASKIEQARNKRKPARDLSKDCKIIDLYRNGIVRWKIEIACDCSPSTVSRTLHRYGIKSNRKLQNVLWLNHEARGF